LQGNCLGFSREFDQISGQNQRQDLQFHNVLA
jgi:hypothetical protein